MSNTTVDILNIEFNADVDKATKDINTLSDTTKQLEHSLGVTEAAMDKFASSMQRLGTVSNNTDFKSLTEGLSTLSGFKISKPNARNLNSIITSLSGLNNIKSSTMSGLGTAVSSFQALSNVKIGKPTIRNISQFVQACNSISAKGTKNLSELLSAVSQLGHMKVPAPIGNNMHKIAVALEELNSHEVDAQKFERLGRALKSLEGLNTRGLSGALNGLAKLPKINAALGSMDFEKFGHQINNLGRELMKVPPELSRTVRGVNDVNKASRQLNGTLETSHKVFTRVKRAAGFISNVSHILGAFRLVGAALQAAVSNIGGYIESVNLFKTAMGDTAEAATAAGQSISQSLGLDFQQWANAQGVFQTMTTGMGIVSDKATIMSQNLTQLGYDLASYYNIDVEDAMVALRSGLAGEMQAVRRFGYDLSDTRLQQDMFTWGIERNAKGLTQASKATLRYRQLMEQVKTVQGDMARTLDSPMNQLRQLEVAFKDAGRAIAEVFLPMMQAIIPMATNVMKAIAAVARAMSSFFGGLGGAKGGLGKGGAAPKARMRFMATPPRGQRVNDGPGGAPMRRAHPAMFAALPKRMKADGFGRGDTKATGSGVRDLTKDFANLAKAAEKAKYKIREVRDETLGFDELHIIDPFQQINEGQGHGGKGHGGKGHGGAGGVGGFGEEDIDFDLPTYDMVGLSDAQQAFEAWFDKLKKGTAETCQIMAETFERFFQALKNQILAFDWGGLFDNLTIDFINMLNRATTALLKAFGPALIAFNVPATVYEGLKLLDTLFQTLEATVMVAGDALMVFNEHALLPLAAWLGVKVRGAFQVCEAALQSWRTWILHNHTAVVEFAGKLGEGVGVVLDFAMALGDLAAIAVNGVFILLNEGVQKLCDGLLLLRNVSGVVESFGIALGIYLLDNAIIRGLTLLTNHFAGMTAAIVKTSPAAKEAIEAMAQCMQQSAPAVMKLKDQLKLFGTALITSHAEARKARREQSLLRTAVYKTGIQLKEYVQRGDAVTGLQKRVTAAMKRTRGGVGQLNRSYDTVTRKMTMYRKKRVDASLAETAARGELTRLKAQTQAMSKETGKFARRVAQSRVAVAERNVALRASVSALRRTQEVQAGHLTQSRASLALRKQEITALMSKRAAVARNTVALGASVVSQTAYTTATHVATAATKLASVATKGFGMALSALPFMILLPLMSKALEYLRPLIEWIGKGIGNLFGFKGGLDEVDTGFFRFINNLRKSKEEEEKAREAAEQLQSEYQELTDSVTKFADASPEFQAALDEQGVSAEEFSQKLMDQGRTLDDVKQAHDDFVNGVINNGEKLVAETDKSLDQYVDIWQNNLEFTRTFGDNLEKLADLIGVDTSNAFIKEMANNPTKYAEVVAKYLKEPTEATTQKMQQLAKECNIGHEIAETVKGDEVETALNETKSEVEKQSEGIGKTAGETAGEAVEAGVNASLEKVKSKTNEFKGHGTLIGEKLVTGIKQGLETHSKTLYDAAGTTFDRITVAFDDKKFPTKFKDYGKAVAEKFADGLSAQMTAVNRGAEALKQQVADALDCSTDGRITGAGNSVGAAYAQGLTDKSSVIQTTAEGLSAAAAFGLLSKLQDAKTSGECMASAFVDKVVAAADSARDAGTQVSEAATDGLQSIEDRFQTMGESAGTKYSDGVSGRSDYAYKAGSSIAGQAKSGAADVSLYWTGRDVAQGFINGIYSKSNGVYWAGYNIGITAVNAARAAANVHSPSRKMIEVGQYLGDGLAIGMEQRTADVAKSSTNMMMSALNAANVQAEQGFSDLQLGALGSMDVKSTHAVEVDWNRLEDVMTASFTHALENNGGMTVEMDGVTVGQTIRKSCVYAGIGI